jgi:hypothetical protein
MGKIMSLPTSRERQRAPPGDDARWRSRLVGNQGYEVNSTSMRVCGVKSSAALIWR